jgi:hypothetical protein
MFLPYGQGVGMKKFGSLYFPSSCPCFALWFKNHGWICLDDFFIKSRKQSKTHSSQRYKEDVMSKASVIRTQQRLASFLAGLEINRDLDATQNWIGSAYATAHNHYEGHIVIYVSSDTNNLDWLNGSYIIVRDANKRQIKRVLFTRNRGFYFEARLPCLRSSKKSVSLELHIFDPNEGNGTLPNQ